MIVLELNSSFNQIMSDCLILGILPSYHFRVAYADLTLTTKAISNIHGLSLAMQHLSNKTILGALFLAELTKDKQRVSIQWKDETNRSVLAYSDRVGRIKAVAYPGNFASGDLRNDFILGQGILKVIRWEEDSTFYQSFTNLIEDTVEANIAKFIEESEQIQSLISMETWEEEETCTTKGIILQALPESSAESIQTVLVRSHKFLQEHLNWKKTSSDFLSDLTSLLEDDLQILVEHKPMFQCDCSRNKVSNIIVSLGQKEAESILLSEGMIEITCEFCRTSYRFDEKDTKRFFL